VVSAIGHDVDTPLLDFVADVRASTPTDAAKRIVPDVREQRAAIEATRQRVCRALISRVHTERRLLVALRSRPVMADPLAMITARRQELDALTDRATRRVAANIHRAGDQVKHLRSQVRALSPLATLERGYAVVQHADGQIVTDPVDVAPDELLKVLVARGDFAVRPVSGTPAPA
jgi:exodeoxyribonuclease VII large subunit